MSTSADDHRWMGTALTLAGRGLGQTWPNPSVGCVLVRDGRVVGRGWTAKGGRPHAETQALNQAGDAANGATAYVTLEPCAHHGETPPCAEALVGAGIARVVTALEDPDPRVAGRGHKILASRGIAVEIGCRAPEAEAITAGFLTRTTQGRPLTTLKLAMSLDGRIATASGESRWITGPQARRHVHLMRAETDAVLIGAGTALADDPMLDIRDMGMTHRSPVRIVADGSLSLPLTGRLARSARQQPLWILHRKNADRARKQVWEDIGATMIEVPDGTLGTLDLTAALQRLGDHGLTHILCEGGGKLAAGLMLEDLIDNLVTISAGLTLGSDAHPGLAALGLEQLAAAPRFRLAQTRQLGNDMLLHHIRDPTI